MTRPRVLIACEFSGAVRDAFTAAGADAWSCDLLPTEAIGQHIQGDARDVLHAGWDLMVAFPPCTDLAVSGARWWAEKGLVHGPGWAHRDHAPEGARTMRLAAWMHTRLCDCWTYTPDNARGGAPNGFQEGTA